MPVTLAALKTYLNRTIFTATARHIVLDIKGYYYGTLMPEHEHTQMLLSLMPTEIIAQHNLRNISINKKVLLEV